MPDYAPPGWPTLVPRIFTDDPDGLCAFVRAVFGATGDSVGGRPAELAIGDSILMVSGTEAREAASAVLYVYVPDTDAVYQRAVARGAEAMEAPLDTPYGDRRAMVRDPWGNTWQIATRVR